MDSSAALKRRRAKRQATSQHRGRVLALQVLYEVDLTQHEWRDALAGLLDAPEADASPRVAAFAENILEGVLAALDRIDAIIERHAPMWPVEQLSPVDRNVLRLAVYEMLPESSVPPRVAINEAVELAKEFGGEASSRFVNGVLGSALEELAPGR